MWGVFCCMGKLPAGWLEPFKWASASSTLPSPTNAVACWQPWNILMVSICICTASVSLICITILTPLSCSYALWLTFTKIQIPVYFTSNARVWVSPLREYQGIHYSNTRERCGGSNVLSLHNGKRNIQESTKQSPRNLEMQSDIVVQDSILIVCRCTTLLGLKK